MIKIRAYSLAEFVEAYLPAQRPARGIKATVLHHTWSPTAAQYKGLATIVGIRRYHIRNGFSEIAANAYAAPDGKVYNGRPLSMSNYAHAHISKAWSQVTADARTLASNNRQFFNYYGFGIETVGDFDKQNPAQSVAMRTSLDVLAAVHTLYKLPPERLFLHRDVANKTCPGKRVSREWARAEIAKRLDGKTDLHIILLPEEQEIVCNAVLEGGTTRCDLRGIAEGLGFVVSTEHFPEGEIYLTKGSP